MVTREQIRHVSRLAKLSLSAEEEERLSRQLAEILEYVARLREIDDTALEAALEAAPGQEAEAPSLRPDEPTPSLPREAVLALAPRTDGETFRVPAVLEGRALEERGGA
jgi:aspartyl-tRNA(Asn)/glutamyl-tRNA(Gln) amidotransferase subunit C